MRIKVTNIFFHSTVFVVCNDCKVTPIPIRFLFSPTLYRRGGGGGEETSRYHSLPHAIHQRLKSVIIQTLFFKRKVARIKFTTPTTEKMETYSYTCAWINESTW